MLLYCDLNNVSIKSITHILQILDGGQPVYKNLTINTPKPLPHIQTTQLVPITVAHLTFFYFILKVSPNWKCLNLTH